jgi:hypothetical protein
MIMRRLQLWQRQVRHVVFTRVFLIKRHDSLQLGVHSFSQADRRAGSSRLDEWQIMAWLRQWRGNAGQATGKTATILTEICKNFTIEKLSQMLHNR